MDGQESEHPSWAEEAPHPPASPSQLRPAAVSWWTPGDTPTRCFPALLLVARLKYLASRPAIGSNITQVIS